MAELTNAAYERIAEIFDEMSFVEIGAGAAGHHSHESNGDGVVTGYGTIGGRLVYVYSQNPSVLGGSVGVMHARKISNIYNMALNMGAPVLALIDCAGIRLKEGNGSLFSFGKIYSHISKASGVVPQIAAVYGNCGGGLSTLASMCDFVFMEKNAKLFLNSPNAITGNYEEKCDTAGSAYQTEQTGLVSFCGSSQEISEKIRDLINYLPLNNDEDAPELKASDDLNRSVAGIDSLKDKSEVLKQLADDGAFFEIKKKHAVSIVCGFLRINGRTIGAVANNKDLLCHIGVTKAVRFIRFCDAFNIPVLTLCDAGGFARDLADEIQLPAALGKLAYTYSSATVPKVTVVTGKAYGTAGIVMGSKALETDLVYAWPNAQMGFMDAALLEKITEADLCKDGNSTIYNVQHGFIDDIVEPMETRQRLAASFEMLYTKNVASPVKKHGTV